MTAFQGYDIIGDVHGQATQLETLLRALGYRQSSQGVWGHKQRQALFVGDLIDKGPDPAGALVLVYRMIEAGHARMVVGNHELNWIQQAADHTNDIQSFLDATAKHHSRFPLVERYQYEPETLLRLFNWLRRQPIYIDEPNLRVVHACWDQASINCLRKNGIHTLDDVALAAYRTTYSPVYFALDMVIAGCEHSLPGAANVENFRTQRRRIRWWNKAAARVNPIELQPVQGRHPGYPEDAPAVFFGHYALVDQPRAMAHNQASVDYSAVYGGPLVAYRYTPGQRLSDDHFVAV